METIVNPAQVRHVVDRAIRIAAAERTVTCIIVPNDVQEMDAVASPPRSHGNVYSGIGHALPRPTPTDDEIARAAAVLNEGEKVAILVGAGALHAGAEVVEVANLLGAGVAKALLGKAAVPDNLPFVTGSIGLLGTRPSYEMMQDCDTLLMVGTTFPYAEFLPKDGQARAVQIDIQPRNFNLRYPTEVNLVGDSVEVLKRLASQLRPKKDGEWQKTIEDNVASWWRELEAKAMEEANPINPQRIFWELSPLLPDNVILCGDCGSHTNWYARDIKIRRGMMGSLSGKLATMGSGVPYAIAAKMAHPDRPAPALALRAMPVAAGVVGDAAVRAVLANFDMSTERRGATGFDRPHDAAFNASHRGAMSSPVGSAMAAENVRHLQGRTHGRALRRAAPPPGPGSRAGSGSWQWWSSPPACSAPSSTGCCGPRAPG